MAVLLSLTTVLGGIETQAQTQTPAPPASTLLGQVENVEAATRTLKMKTADGSLVNVTLAEKGTVVKVAPGETSLQNAAPIAFETIAAGDRLMVRGGARSGETLTGALRIVVMAQTDLAARDAEHQRAWRERGIAGTVTGVDAAKGEFTMNISGAPQAPAGAAAPSASPAATPEVAVDATKATLHRYADTSIKFADAKPATIKDVAVGDQARLLGKRSEDGARITAERIVFGSFRTMALAIEKVDAATGTLSVKDLETNKKFTISVVSGGTIRKIPAEMATMFAMMSGGGGGGGRPGMDGQGGRPGMGSGMGQGRPPAGGGGGRPGSGGGRGRMDDMVDRMPAITLAELKKDDWVGAVVGKVDAAGKAVAFNMLAGIEVFAARANRGGGVDVGMPAGLLDGGMGVP